MEFNEKLQELRKNKGLTQEELAESLYVSRTAVSKWESGRGYPNIESLKEISKFFSVSIDELLSGEKLLFIAENENKTNIKNICELLFGAVDLFYVLLIYYIDRYTDKRLFLSRNLDFLLELTELKLGVPLNWIVYRVGYG